MKYIFNILLNCSPWRIFPSINHRWKSILKAIPIFVKCTYVYLCYMTFLTLRIVCLQPQQHRRSLKEEFRQMKYWRFQPFPFSPPIFLHRPVSAYEIDFAVLREKFEP